MVAGVHADDPDLVLRRRHRLHDELVDERVPLPVEGETGEVLLAELDYARHPPLHEGVAPRFGALITDHHDAGELELDAGAWVELPPAGKQLARRLADGRAAFLVRTGDGRSRLAVFDHTMEYEASLVDLQRRSGAVVVQRTAAGLIRVVTPRGIVTWDGVRWLFKPLASRYVRALRRLVPEAGTAILEGLLDLSVHWLSGGRVGATLVWALDGETPASRPSLDLAAAMTTPELSLLDRGHFGAVLSMAAQLDRAMLVDVHGTITHVGAGLIASRRAVDLVAPVGGTRHTSARRFSFDEPGTLVFVVSQDGPVTVFRGGGPAVVLRVDPCQSWGTFDPPPLGTDPSLEEHVHCSTCDRTLLVDVARVEGWDGGPDAITCPVCGQPHEVDAFRAAVRGVLCGRPGTAGQAAGERLAG